MAPRCSHRQACDKYRACPLHAGRRASLSAGGAAVQKRLELSFVDRKSHRQPLHRHTDGRGVGLAEDGHMQIFTQI